MRQFVGAAVFVALVACGGPGGAGGTTSEADAATTSSSKRDAMSGQTLPVAPAPKASEEVVLDTNGITAGDTRFAFGAQRMVVEQALSRLLGEPELTEGEEEYCDGSMVFAGYDGGFVVNFVDGKLAGWFWREPMDDEMPPKSKVSTDSFMTLGTTRAQVEKLPGYEFFADSTLGEEFYIENKPGGFFDRGRVATLFSGTQCFIR